MTLSQLSSAIINELFGGNLIPLSNRALISQEQLEDEVIAERELILREWYLKGTLTLWDMAFSVHCIPVNCDDMNQCPCKGLPGKITQHFEVPHLLQGLSNVALLFVGSTDKMVSYKVYYDIKSLKYQKYRKRPIDEPYVYVDRALNKNGMHDVWLFNAPFVKYVTITGIFRDPRQLEQFSCCDSNEYLEMGSISSEILRRILAKKISLYRTLPPPANQITS